MPASFLFIFVFFYMTQIKYKLLKTDGVLGTLTWGGKMEGIDESTELGRHPKILTFYLILNFELM